ncbi:MAG TPA: methionine synthase [Candidatus Binataceae bacterium]|nr:methionine synthase [Candidatus Binataceae bacterium]
MFQQSSRLERLRACLRERILVIDGALGTSIQERDLKAADFGGASHEGCNEQLIVTQPEVLRALHASFLAAGADLIETNTFGATAPVLAEFNLRERARDINRQAAAAARALADSFSSSQWPRFVIGAMGPTTKSISVTGGITFAELTDAYYEQALGLLEGGADVLLLETVQDTLNAKAGLLAIDRAKAALGVEAGVAVQGTVESTGTLLAGQDIESFYVSLAHHDLLWIGLNCATGPDFMTDHLRTLAELSRFPVACVPNAGLPDEDGRYHETPAALSAKIERFVKQGWLNLVGGCCGTGPEHIRTLAEMARRYAPRAVQAVRRSAISGIETLVIDEQTRPIIVGERTNVLGSRRFKQLINAGRFDEAAEVGRAQVRRGAHLLDVCLQDPDRDERDDLGRFLDVLVRQVRVPLMIDSTDPDAVKVALERSQGKALINSINLEDGPDAERLTKIVELARCYGAALVVGCIDEDRRQAQAVTRQRKLEIAQRTHELLTGRFGMVDEDLFFDALVFPIGTGDATYTGSAAETIEGIRAIKSALPRCKTVLGVSNVSFGLPEAGREVLNSVMLHHCVAAGLDLAIVNAEKLKRYPSIPALDRELAEDLMWARGADPIAAFTAHFRARVSAPEVDSGVALTLDERLARCVVEGSREGLLRDLELALGERRPLTIINGPLMKGMDEVGRLFNANQMIVAEVLQSAEVMKAAVSYLEPHMEKNESAARGTILLATVKGDVHDIGKTLVDIILTNNGYRVINLGIKVPPEELIRAYNEHHPDAIGLSGLLVKSAQMMVATAQDLRAAGISCPLLVGGAALSARFTRTRIAPEYGGLVAYANDAMQGLALAHQIMDPERRGQLSEQLNRETVRLLEVRRAAPVSSAPSARVDSAVRHDGAIPRPPDLELHALEDFDLAEIFSYMNPAMLYSRHLGLRDAERALATDAPRAVELRRVVESMQRLMIERADIRAGAVYRFFPAKSDRRRLLIYGPDGRPIETLVFGRQSEPPHLCVADFVAPLETPGTDYICLFATTVGPGVRALAARLKDEGEYLGSHVLQVLALEGAEAFAELLHLRIRQWWGINDPPGLGMKGLFQARYRGKRFSFGYPACPRLEDQAALFRLLEPERHIGVRLTEGFMMDPEGSVSALIVHHPEAKYFALSPADIELLTQELDAPQFAPGISA